MGSRYYGIVAYGILIHESDFDFEKLRKEFPDAEFEDEDDRLYDIQDRITGCDHYSFEFGGDAYLLRDRFEEVTLPQSFVIGNITHFPDLYTSHYKDYEEVKQDVIAKYQRYLKNDYPWDDRLIRLSGVVDG